MLDVKWVATVAPKSALAGMGYRKALWPLGFDQPPPASSRHRDDLGYRPDIRRSDGSRRALISPTGFHNLIHGVPLYAVLGLVLPVVGWRSFLIEFVFPTAAATRVTAVITVWVVGSVMVAVVINLLLAVLDYYPARPGPIPTAGFLLAGLVLCMFVSCGVWGAISPILPRDVAIRGALVTGCVLFGIVATLGYLVSR